MTANPIGVYPPQGGGSGAIKLIESFTTVGGEGDVVFSNIPQTYSHLKIMASVMANGSGLVNLFLEFNGDSSFIYSSTYTQNLSGTVTGVSTGTDNLLVVGVAGYTGLASASEILIPGYALNTTHSANGHGVGFQGGNSLVIDGGGLYGTAAPITSILLAPAGQSFLANSIISLYGLA